MGRGLAASIYTNLKHDISFIDFSDISKDKFCVPDKCVVLELGASLLRGLNATDYAGEQRDLMRVVRERIEKGGSTNKLKIQKIDSVTGLKTALGVVGRKEEGRHLTNVALVTDDPTFENRAHVIYVSDDEDEEWKKMVERASKKGNIRVYTYDPTRGVGKSDAFVALLQAL